MARNLLVAVCVAVVVTMAAAKVVKRSREGTKCQVDGVAYEPLQVIDMANPCEQCVCSEVTGLPACVTINSCPSAPCLEPVTVPGMCCPVCFAMLSSRDCVLNDGTVLPAGETIRVQSDNCYEECSCSAFSSGHGNQQIADCQRHCDVSNDW